ncbi:MAG: DNA polymerase III subunit beta [Actinomycetia bacterium]|nr:DNA polymerase III subunit beta [Actinomycetes bacterium]
MQISIAKSELSAALARVIHATASRSSVPSLSGILISCEEGMITFFASDLETSIKTQVEGLITEPGTVAVPGRIFSDIVRSLPESAVSLSLEGEQLTISAQQSCFTIRTLNPDDFVRFPEVTGKQQITLPSETVRSMVGKVIKAVSKDETRAVLTGIYLIAEDEGIKMVATDIYRLAIVTRKLEDPLEEVFTALIPGRAFEEVVKMLDAGDVTISLSQNQILFSFGQTQFVTRKIEGNYPNFAQLLPKEWTVKATVAQSEIFEAVKRVALLAVTNAAIKFSISVEDQDLSLTSQSLDLGSASEHVMIKAEGEDREIAINYSFLQDGLSVIESEFITIEVQDSMKPGIIRAPEEDFLYLVMPMRIN